MTEQPVVSAPTPTPATASAPSTQPSPSVAPSPAPEATSSVAPESAPVSSVAVEPTPELPKQDATPVEAPKEAAPEVAKTAEILLGKEAPEEAAPPKVEEEKDSKQTSDEKKPVEKDSSQSEEPAPLPAYTFETSEGVKLEGESLSKFNNMLAQVEVENKIPHDVMQKLGQSMIAEHQQVLNQTIQKLVNTFQQKHEQTKSEWAEQFKAEHGSKWEGVLANAERTIRTYFGSPEQQKSFRNFLVESGFSNNPDLIRGLAKISEAKREGVPIPAKAPPEAPKSKLSKFYGKR